MAPDTSSDPIADLPFLIFVGVADAAQSVGAAEADAFFRLLDKRDWARCPALIRALDEAASRYPTNWRQYIAGSINKSVPSVMEAVAAAASRLAPEQAALLEADLLHIAGALRKAARRPRLPEAADSSRPFASLEAALCAAAPPDAVVAAGAAARPSALHPRPERRAAQDEAQRRPVVPVPDAALWKSERTRLRCVTITDETDDVRTFHFSAAPERLFSYKPGQFLTLELEIAGKKVRRSYTIASSPSRPHLVAITVKRVPGGVVSNWLHEHLAVGDTLQAVVANGKFNTWDIPAEKVLLLSAGIGITPLMSMARWDFDLCVDRDTVFFHSARKPSDIVFRRELELLRRPAFKTIVTCTNPADEEWNGLRGRMDAAMIEAAVPDFRTRAIFLCGPDAWMRAMREFFLAAGCPATSLHQESFGPRSGQSPARGGEVTAAVAPPAGASPPGVNGGRRPEGAAAEARIVFSRSHKETSCATDEPILDVAERNGIEIESSCRVGSCGTCKVLKTSGVVKYEYCPGLTAAEAAEGYVLTCSSTVEGTVVLDA